MRSTALPNFLAHTRGALLSKPLTLSSAVLPAQLKKMSRIGLRGEPCNTSLPRTSVHTIMAQIVKAISSTLLRPP